MSPTYCARTKSLGTCLFCVVSIMIAGHNVVSRVFSYARRRCRCHDADRGGCSDPPRASVRQLLSRGSCRSVLLASSLALAFGAPLSCAITAFWTLSFAGGVRLLEAVAGPFSGAVRFIPSCDAIDRVALPKYFKLPTVLCCAVSWVATRKVMPALGCVAHLQQWSRAQQMRPRPRHLRFRRGPQSPESLGC